MLFYGISNEMHKILEDSFLGSSAAALKQNGGKREDWRRYATIYHRLQWNNMVVTSRSYEMELYELVVGEEGALSAKHMIQ